jgi:SAM-dependent methyltransferase
MHPNYEYVLNFIRGQSHVGTRSLDYGCGAGEIIRAGREDGLDIFGAEVFYEGGNTKTEIEKEGYLNTIVREIKDDRIDFPDSHFDLIVNNQVLEHVESLDVALREMHRVLKHGGKLLSLFPSWEVWSEGHCGIPFLHRFKKGSSLQFYYALAWRALGKGHCKGAKTRVEWSRDFCEWLDKFTFYRTKTEIVRTFGRYFGQLEFIELDYLLFRLGRISPFFVKVILCSKNSHDKCPSSFVRKQESWDGLGSHKAVDSQNGNTPSSQ